MLGVFEPNAKPKEETKTTCKLAKVFVCCCVVVVVVAVVVVVFVLNSLLMYFQNIWGKIHLITTSMMDWNVNCPVLPSVVWFRSSKGSFQLMPKDNTPSFLAAWLCLEFTPRGYKSHIIWYSIVIIIYLDLPLYIYIRQIPGVCPELNAATTTVSSSSSSSSSSNQIKSN